MAHSVARRYRLTVLVIGIALTLLPGMRLAAAQSVHPDFPVTDGPVHALAISAIAIEAMPNPLGTATTIRFPDTSVVHRAPGNARPALVMASAGRSVCLGPQFPNWPRNAPAGKSALCTLT